MGAVTSVVNTLFGNKSRRILMIGPDGAGKTTILYRLKLGKIVATYSTIGHNIETVEYKGIIFTITDVSNTRKVKNFQRIYVENADGVVFVIDSNDRYLINELRYEIRELMEIFNELPLLIFANKQDLSNAMTTTEITETLKLNRLHHKKWHIQGTSATQGNGLNEGLDWLSKQLYSN